MTKRFSIILLSLLFLMGGLLSPAARDVFSAPAPPTPAPQPNAIDLAPTSAANGFYIANSKWSMISPGEHSAVGTFQFWSWAGLNPDKNLYRFDQIDSYIEAAINAGYQKVGIAITTYNGRGAQYTACGAEFNQGYAQTPYFVRWGPNGVDESADGDANTGDDPVVIADTPDSRGDCDGDGNADPWLLPEYDNPYYIQEYQKFVQALANHLLNSPYRDHVAWVALGTGKDGENKPVDDGDDDALLQAISVEDWKAFVQQVVDIYHDAFSAGSGKPQIPLLLQNAPFYRDVTERRDLATYANSKDVGLSVNGITSDFDLSEACDGGNCIGMYDQVHLYGDNVPIGLESYAYMMGSENEFYWAMARAGDLKPDFLRLSAFWNSQDTPTNRIIAQWISRYIGKGFDAGQVTPPSIWARLREHRDPLYLPYIGSPARGNYWPPVDNYDYFLYQDHDAPHGITIPETDDPRFQASDHRIGWDGTSGQPAHYNAHPYSAILNSAGLYHVGVVKTNGVAVQLEPDPGWTARRSDQASDNYGFFFNADDRYLSIPADLNHPHQVRITVTYLDHGNDRWRLMYDSTSGEKAAMLYAVQPWDVATGLALEDGLPTSGLVPAPQPDYVQKNNTNQWMVATFYIQDGYFGNRLPGGNDFYIDSRNDAGMMDGDEYIHHVDVQKLNDVSQVTPTPTTTPPATTPTATPSPTPPGATATPTPTPPANSISGAVFENHNDDYTQDPDEPGLPGALISLYQSGNVTTPVAQTVSDNSGAYRFDNINPDTYSIIVSPPAGWEMILSSRYVVLHAGETIEHQDFPAQRIAASPTPTPTPTPTGGRIHGLVFDDQNSNGLHESGESGIANMALRLETSMGQFVAETQTDSQGAYEFNGLSSQTYHLYLTLPAGWTATTATDLLVNPGTGEITQNFGVQPAPTPTPTPTPQPSGDFQAYVWNDLDHDGRLDADEPPLAGATVIILNNTGTIEIDRSTTGGDGYARFSLPAPASYVVQEVPPVNMAASTPAEYTFLLQVDALIEIPFGNYDNTQKLYLPLLVQPSS